MQNILKQIRKRYYKWTERAMKLPAGPAVPTERIGTPYGGWIIPKNTLNADSVCYLVGAGEDVSFDLGVAAAYGCTVHIFDPTPRAVQHVDQLIKNLKSGEPTACPTCPGGLYPTYPAGLASKLVLHPVGIWKEDTILEFFAPGDEAHVSHSIVNLQQTARSIKVPVRRLSGLMEELGQTRINLLKIDIEGAEYQVLESILQDKVEIDIICIEYDESAANHFDSKYIDRIEQSLLSLTDAGFHIIAKEPDCHNYTLLHSRRL
jgi:hypothetical protein